MSIQKHALCIVIFTAIVVILAYIPACALSGMVTRVSDSRIVINKGSRDSIAQDQELYVHRIGRPIGKLRVTSVDSLSSEAVVTSLERDEAVKVGDVVSTEPFSIPYTPPPPAEKGNKGSKSTSSTGSDSSATYLDMLKNQTRITTFKKGPKGQVKVGIGEMSLIYSALLNPTLGYAGYGYTYTDPWMAFSVGSALYNQYNTFRKTGAHDTVVVAVTFYDDALIDSQARYFASKEGITDESQIREIRNGVMQQMGTDTNMVFGIKISNHGAQVVQLAPFKWHFYLKDQSGQKITAVKYDDQLDKGVEPRGETQGYIFFPKITPGSSTSGSTVKATLESILGKNTELSW